MNAKGTGLKNIHVLNTRLSTDMLNSLHSEIEFLANSDESPTDDPQKNQFIAEFFQKMPYYAMLQSGMNTDTKFSLGRMIPTDAFTRIMEEPGKEFVEKLNKSLKSGDTSILDDFYNKFKVINNQNRSVSRMRLKDYMIPISTSVGVDSAIEEVIPIKEIAPGIEVYSGESLGLTVVAWNAKFGKTSRIKTIEKLLADNPNKLFVYNSTIGPSKVSIARDFIFQEAANRIKSNNVVGIPTRLKYEADTFATPKLSSYHVSDKTLDDNIKAIDKAIDFLLEEKAKGRPIVFLDFGYGQALSGATPFRGEGINEDRALAPKTFLHLSTRLAELEYKNNNYDQIVAGREQLQKVAGVYTDQQVEDKIQECYS